MNTRFNEITKTLHTRWKPEWSKEVTLISVARAFNTSLAAVEALMGKTAEMRATGKFSEQGLRDEIRNAAMADTVPALKRASEAVERVRQDLAGQKARLAIPAPDVTNAAQAIVRSEMRQWLRTLPQSQAVQMLLSDTVDDRMLQAAFEAPPIMSGLTDEMRDTVQKRVVERKFGPELARVGALEEAVDVAQSAVGVALYQLRQEAEFGASDDRAFDAWMGEATSAAEAAEEAKPLDAVLGEMRDDVDEIFARAFPNIYPNHPVNNSIRGV